MEALDINYSATVYNLVRSVDLELKKIDALTVRRDTVTLTDQTTPAGSGQMYDDAAVPGLSGAGFTLYQRVEEVPVSDMAALGLRWLKSDGTTATGAKPSADCIQVSPAKNSAGQSVSVSNGGLTDAQGRLRFYSLLPGTYYLVETRAPDGYPLANPTGGTGGCCITVNLTDSGVTYLQPDFNAGAAQTALSRAETAAPTVTVYEMLIQNGRGGAELPQTGGMGSRWSTVMGLALIVGAGALLIRRKNRRGVG